MNIFVCLIWGSGLFSHHSSLHRGFSSYHWFWLLLVTGCHCIGKASQTLLFVNLINSFSVERFWLWIFEPHNFCLEIPDEYIRPLSWIVSTFDKYQGCCLGKESQTPLFALPFKSSHRYKGGPRISWFLVPKGYHKIQRKVGQKIIARITPNQLSWHTF